MEKIEKKDIVTMFLKEGLQLDAAALEYFISAPEKTEEFTQTMKRDGIKPQPIISIDFVRHILDEEKLEKEKRQPNGAVKIIKEFLINHEKQGNVISVQDYSNRLTEIYEKKRKMLVDRVEQAKLVSINKIQKQKDFALICMTREKDQVEKSALVEDLTGNVVVYFESVAEFDSLVENDVVAMLCETSDTFVKAKQIVWPDVPLKRTVNKSEENACCLFVSDFHMDSVEFDKGRYEKFVKQIWKMNEMGSYSKIYIFILGGISGKPTDIEKLLGDLPKDNFKIVLSSKKDATPNESKDMLYSKTPIMLEVEGIKILACQGDELHTYKQIWGPEPTNVMKNLLKRKDLNPFAGQVLAALQKDTIMGQTPDIFASGSFHSLASSNYKGITIITTGSLLGEAGEAAFWTVNLKTREINKLTLA